MSAMANTTPIVTTVMKLATKEKTPKDVDATPKVNIQDFLNNEGGYNSPLLVAVVLWVRGGTPIDVGGREGVEKKQWRVNWKGTIKPATIFVIGKVEIKPRLRNRAPVVKLRDMALLRTW
ncbi:hypothetical protein Tco_0227459 [Tanacetum coccineum]